MLKHRPPPRYLMTLSLSDHASLFLFIWRVVWGAVWGSACNKVLSSDRPPSLAALLLAGVGATRLRRGLEEWLR
jgi:hypothetical protein